MSADPAEARFGEVDLTSCDREPIHVPGSIQPHGVLLVLDRERLMVEQAAGDTHALLGIERDALPGLHLSALVESDAERFVTEQLGTAEAHVVPLLKLDVRARRTPKPLDLTLHATRGTAVLEFEPARRAATAAGDPIALLKLLLGELQSASGVEDCCRTAARTLREITGYDRAMVYRFLHDGSGAVIAEDVAPGFEPYLGLHYPASDIPKQARELYRANWLRVICDVDYVPAPLEPAINPRLRGTLDMSHCSLRSVSPIHLEYLRNMGVSATLVGSIIFRRGLWGMLVLHHYSPRVVSADLRVACEMYAQMFSLQLEAKVEAELSGARIAARSIREQAVQRLVPSTDIGAALATPELAHYVGATGVAVRFDGRLHLAGESPPAEEVEALVKWLDERREPLYETDRLGAEFPALAPRAAVASGLLALRIAREPQDPLVLWFRPEASRTVRWAGDPGKPVVVGPHGARLTPRASFAAWLEEVRGRSAPWTELEREAAEALRVVLLETVLQAADLARAEREAAYERQSLLLAELDHRVKNTLARIHSLVSTTKRSAASVESFARALEWRVQAMSQAHNLLAEARWVGASLQKLLKEEIAPVVGHDATRIEARGADLLLTPAAALAFSLVLHELITNAIKYGALSNADGRVAVDWGLDESRRELWLRWRESGGPAPAPGKPGFGSQLIARTVRHELRGEVTTDFAAEGLALELRVPSRHVADA